MLPADDASTLGPPAAPSPVGRPAAGGRYVLGDEIARGGMGVVFRATDTALGREVAVKLLHDRYAPDSGVARRFLEEARITGQLQHPGIPPVHDLGHLPDGRPFLAMKLIKGETLEALLRRRADDRGRLIAIFEQVCQAVAYAHAHGVIHRDLKPANVMVGSFAEVQVMDWGLAKVLGPRPDADPEATTPGTAILSPRDADGDLTRDGTVMGTPAFMPPEQAVGAVHKIDARSDVFGLGGILAVVLTGAPPFAATSAETTRVLAATGDVADCFARLDACGADPELVALCKRCLCPKPEGRPADAGEVSRAIAELRAAADERARRAEVDLAAAEVRAVEERKRRRWQLATAAAVALTAVAAAGGAAWVAWVAGDRARLAEERGRLADDLVAANGRLEEDHYYRQLGLSQLELTAGQSGRAAALLDAVRPGLRRWDWNLARRLCGGEPANFTLGPGNSVEHFVYLPPDGSRLAVGGFDARRGHGSAWVVAADTGRVLRELAGHGKGLVHEVAVTSTADGGVTVVTASEDGVARVFDADSGVLKREYRGGGSPVVTVSVSPDGKFAATGDNDGAVRVWEVATGREVQVLTGHTSCARRVRFRPDGLALASAGWDGTVRVWDVSADGARLRHVLSHDNEVLGLAWSLDGTRLAATGGRGVASEVRLWDAARGALEFVRRGHTSITEQTTFSPDGRLFATVSGHLGEKAAGEVILWDTATGQQALTLRGVHFNPPRAVAFRPDGGQLVTGDDGGRVVVWNLRAGLDAAPALPWRPTNARELVARARHLGQQRGEHAAAADLIAAALREQPALADHRSDPPRLFAAGCALVAAKGTSLPPAEQARWRGKALAWTRMEFEAAVNHDVRRRPAALRKVDSWRRDGWFSSVREAAALAELPAAERADWERLWADLAAALPAPP